MTSFYFTSSYLYASGSCEGSTRKGGWAGDVRRAPDPRSGSASGAPAARRGGGGGELAAAGGRRRKRDELFPVVVVGEGFNSDSEPSVVGVA